MVSCRGGGGLGWVCGGVVWCVSAAALGSGAIWVSALGGRGRRPAEGGGLGVVFCCLLAAAVVWPICGGAAWCFCRCLRLGACLEECSGVVESRRLVGA